MKKLEEISKEDGTEVSKICGEPFLYLDVFDEDSGIYFCIVTSSKANGQKQDRFIYFTKSGEIYLFYNDGGWGGSGYKTINVVGIYQYLESKGYDIHNPYKGEPQQKEAAFIQELINKSSVYRNATYIYEDPDLLEQLETDREHKEQPQQEQTAEEIVDEYIGSCTCTEGYTLRRLTDPNCHRCESDGITQAIEAYATQKLEAYKQQQETGIEQAIKALEELDLGYGERYRHGKIAIDKAIEIIQKLTNK